MKSFSLSILTLGGETFKGDVESITLPTEMGQVTILANHASLVSLLKPGGLIIRTKTKEGGREDGNILYMAIPGGFVEVGENHDVVILTDTADRAEDIDIEKAQEARVRAQKALKELREKGDANEVDFTRFQTIVNHEMARVKTASRHRERSNFGT